MKVVIVDDEKHFQDSLSHLIEQHFSNLEIVAIASSVEEGAIVIEELQPDLVFLDVEIGNRTGFDLLDHLKNKNFSLIFVTAHNHYAVNAFRYSAIDFLMKPIVLEDLREAVKKATRNIEQIHLETQLEVMRQSLESISEQDRKIVLKGLESFHVVKTPDILWCSAEGSYTSFHLINGTEVVVSKHLKEYEKLLASNQFYRVHRSYLINLTRIIRYDRAEGVLVFTGEHHLPVSLKRERMDELISKL